MQRLQTTIPLSNPSFHGHAFDTSSAAIDSIQLEKARPCGSDVLMYIMAAKMGCGLLVLHKGNGSTNI